MYTYMSKLDYRNSCVYRIRCFYRLIFVIKYCRFIHYGLMYILVSLCHVFNICFALYSLMQFKKIQYPFMHKKTYLNLHLNLEWHICLFSRETIISWRRRINPHRFKWIITPQITHNKMEFKLFLQRSTVQYKYTRTDLALLAGFWGRAGWKVKIPS